MNARRRIVRFRSRRLKGIRECFVTFVLWGVESDNGLVEMECFYVEHKFAGVIEKVIMKTKMLCVFADPGVFARNPASQ